MRHPNIQPMREYKLPVDGCIFKHSTRCPISTAAAREVEQFDWEVPLYWVNVVEERPMSNWIAEETGVRHESPQLLFFSGGRVVKALSHSAIRSENFIGTDEKAD